MKCLHGHKGSKYLLCVREREREGEREMERSIEMKGRREMERRRELEREPGTNKKYLIHT
jgi:hypothetical protein